MTTFIVSFDQSNGNTCHAGDTRPVTRWLRSNAKSVTRSPYLRVNEVIYVRLDFHDDTAAVHFKLSDIGGEIHQPDKIERAWQWVLKSHAINGCHVSDAVHEHYHWIAYFSNNHPWEHSTGVKGRITIAHKRHLREDEIAEELRRDYEIRERRRSWTTMALSMEQFGIPLTQSPPEGLFDD